MVYNVFCSQFGPNLAASNVSKNSKFMCLILFFLVLFLYPPEYTLRFSGIFRANRNVILGKKWVNLSYSCHRSPSITYTHPPSPPSPQTQQTKKPSGFLIISGVIERDQWHESDCIQTLLMRFWCPKIINLVSKQSFPKKLTFSNH